jgi:hypothetical protein
MTTGADVGAFAGAVVATAGAAGGGAGGSGGVFTWITGDADEPSKFLARTR